MSPEKTRENYFPAKRRVLKKTTVYSVSSVSTKNDACRVYGVFNVVYNSSSDLAKLTVFGI